MTFQEELKAALNKGVTFAQVDYSTQVKTAAAHKDKTVTKQVTANVQLFDSVKNDVYVNAVKRAAEKLGQDASNFEASKSHFTHTDCYSIVVNNGTYYLYCIYNSAKSRYYIDGKECSKQEVMELLTPSARKAMESKTTHNKTNDIEHDVIIRTIKLSNIERIKVGGKIITQA